MKPIIFFIPIVIVLTLLTSVGFGQNIGINADGSKPDANAMLDIKASDKGLLIPRTSTTSRLIIPNTKGLLVYDTTINSFWYNDGANWQQISNGSSSLNGTTNYITKFTGTSTAGNSQVFDNGKYVGIGTTTPLARLHVSDSSVLFSASGDVPASPHNTPISFGGRRLMWYADKAAFRVGYAVYNEWDSVNIGKYSVGMGYGNMATGLYSVSIGNSSGASGISSIATGDLTNATGDYTFTTGQFTTAKGPYSFAAGYYSAANGYGSIALGYRSNANGQYAVALGNNTFAAGNFLQHLVTVPNLQGHILLPPEMHLLQMVILRPQLVLQPLHRATILLQPDINLRQRAILHLPQVTKHLPKEIIQPQSGLKLLREAIQALLPGINRMQMVLPLLPWVTQPGQVVIILLQKD